MGFIERLKEQLLYFHEATDIPLQLVSSGDEVIMSLPEKPGYCDLIQESYRKRAFCGRLHKDKADLAARLGEGYIFTCPAGVIRFMIPVRGDKKPDYFVVAGPMAIKTPDTGIFDGLAVLFGLDKLEDKLMERLYEGLSQVPVMEPVRVQHLCSLLFSIVDNLPRLTDDDMEKKPRAESAVPGVQKAIMYINAHYSERLSLKQVASFVGLNPSYLSSVFKHELGISFSDYLVEKRISEARDLLLRSNRSLSDISQSVGFENQSYFSRVFRSRTGFSPKEYREKKRE